jgi:dienelactone hydrolase
MLEASSIPALPRARPPRGTGRDLVRTGVGTALDSVVMRGVSAVVERVLIPTVEDVEALRGSASAFLRSDLLEQPRGFFEFADRPVMPRAVSIHGGRDLRGGAVYRRKLQTDYRPYAAPGCEPEVEISNGDPILLEHWKHEGRQTRGTVIGLHGFAMGRPALDAVALFARQWYDRGLDVALMTLPHHGRRSGADARFSGEHFAVPHVGRLAEAVREAIYEILVVRNWLRDESDGPVGLMGLSLGGYLTSLAVGLCDDFDFAVPMVPPACMGDLAWRVFRTTRHGPRSGAPAIGEAELRSGFRVHSPLAHSLRVPKERILIVAGRGDRVVPPEHPTALWEHWEKPPIHWFSGSHIAPFGRARVVGAISRHFEALGIL